MERLKLTKALLNTDADQRLVRSGLARAQMLQENWTTLGETLAEVDVQTGHRHRNTHANGNQSTRTNCRWSSTGESLGLTSIQSRCTVGSIDDPGS